MRGSRVSYVAPVGQSDGDLQDQFQAVRISPKGDLYHAQYYHQYHNSYYYPQYPTYYATHHYQSVTSPLFIPNNYTAYSPQTPQYSQQYAPNKNPKQRQCVYVPKQKPNAESPKLENSQYAHQSPDYDSPTPTQASNPTIYTPPNPSTNSSTDTQFFPQSQYSYQQSTFYTQPSQNDNGQADKLPRIFFQGEIIVVDSIHKVKPALESLFKDGTAATMGIGFDMEWKPSFGKGTPRNPTSLIQLSTDKVCVIFWMMYLEHRMPVELYDVLASPHILKIGQCLDCGDNERLSQEFYITLANSVDIALLAKRKGFRKTSLKEQTKVLLGKNLNKFLCTSNWADIRLTPAQIRYAATDAYVTFLLYHKLATLPDAPPPPVRPPDGDESDSDNPATPNDASESGESTTPTPPNATSPDHAEPDDDDSTQKQEGGEPNVAAQREIRAQPEMVPSSKCPHCERWFMKKVQLYAHLDHAHLPLLPPGPQTCEVCLKQFRKYSAMKIHQAMSGHDSE